MASYIYKIRKEFEGYKVEDFLKYFKLGNEKLKELKGRNRIYVNDVESLFSSTLHEGDTLKLINEDKLDIKPLDKRLDIVYEDEYLLIINKPAGIAIHSDGSLNVDNTLANMVASYYKRKKLDIPVRYLHRLDYDTSGLIIFCKDILSMSYLSDLLSRHEIKRDYLALVSGEYKGREEIELPIGRDRHVNGKYIVFKGGKYAYTSVKTLKTSKKYSLVRLSLKTGRTHQIRVHMAYCGNPLLGDTLYGGGLSLIKRQALHSYFISFKHPITNKLIEKSVRPPHDMENLIEKLNKKTM